MNAIDVSVIGMQILLPLTLLAWFGFAPLSGRIGFLIQTVATGAVLAALQLAAIWIVPPWWFPYLYLTLWVAIALFRYAGIRQNHWFPPSLWGRAGLLAIGGLGVFASSVIAAAVNGRSAASNEPVVHLDFPLGPGTYLIAHGGATSAINGHFLTLTPTTERQSAYRGQSYAVDVIKLGRLGLRAPGWRPADPTVYAIFGEIVYAPCSGPVLAAADDKPDMRVPIADQSRLEGNHVVLDCDGVAVLLAHLQQGSVLIEPGERVEAGQPLGRVGNSGQTNEPHLHIHAQTIPAEGPLFSGDPVFIDLDERFPVRNGRVTIEAVPKLDSGP